MALQFPDHRTIGPARNFLILLAILFASYASVWLLEDVPLLAAGAIGGLILIFLCYVRSFKLGLVIIIAALLGTGHEMVFASLGYWSYRVPTWLGVPAYLPAVWAVIAMLSAALYKGLLSVEPTGRLLRALPERPRSLGYTLAGFCLTFVAIYFLASSPLMLIGCFIAIEALYLALMRSLPLALVGCFTFAAGMLADLFFVSQGVWSYPENARMWHHVPLYIFAYWHIMGVLLAGLYASLDAAPSDDLTKSPALPAN